MNLYDRRRRGGKRLQRKGGAERNVRGRLAALLLCLAMAAGFLPALALAANADMDGRVYLSSIVTFDSITLHDAAGAEIKDRALLKQGQALQLRYTYSISEDGCMSIAAGTKYYLETSPHLVLPHLEAGSDLTAAGEQKPFGRIYADGSSAWVEFLAKEDGTDTVLSGYDGLNNADFYLDCQRAGAVPLDETPIEGNSNLYAMKFENSTQLAFGYDENEPVTAKAQIDKRGLQNNKTITWTISYTPWQNPSESDPVDLYTPFELRDTIDTALHTFVEGSVRIDGELVTTTTTRVPGVETYVIVEPSPDGNSTALTFGGTKFNAGAATKGNPAKPLTITYDTSIQDQLLLPGGKDGKVTNAVELFAGKDDVFDKLNISGSSAVDISQPAWLEKTGTTTRHTDGTGSTTDWTVTFHPNGFTGFTELTLHDQLPTGSTLDIDSVKADGTFATAVEGEGNSFTVSGIAAKAPDKDVVITYQTSVPEIMYENGTNLGSNVAWFTFRYGGQDYTTPQAKKDVGSGDGTGTPGTARLVKTNEVYNAADRTIKWTVKINPHKANLKSGTFIDDLSALGPACNVSGHPRGLEVAGDIAVLVGDSAPVDKNKVKVTYSNQKITVAIKDIGYQTITLAYTTKVCDPCVFASNTTNAQFKNAISTDDMVIGNSTAGCSASADSTAAVSANVLKKNPPVYDYAAGIMTWTIEVDAAGLSMADVVLTDELQAGLTYVKDSLITSPEITGASASANGQMLTIELGTVSEKTTVTFKTSVDPEPLGFGGDKPVVVNNTIHMNGKADGVKFAEVSHSVQQNFSNHGLVKSSAVHEREQFIQYEVLINPYRLALPEAPSLVDTLDQRLQLDTDTLTFYGASLHGTTAAGGQRPGYEKTGEGRPLKLSSFDPDTNSFTVPLPISGDSTDAYVLTYRADIIDYQTGSYSNSVRFDGGGLLLGGNKDNSASVGGGGGGGGGGVAARKASIAVVKTDGENHDPLPGVSFRLYQWDSDRQERGLPFAQGITDAKGELSFKVTPGAFYELVELESAPGYGSKFGWAGELPEGAAETDGGLLLKAGAAKSVLTLELTNDAHTTDLVFRLVNESLIPMAGEKVLLFTSDPAGQPDPVPTGEAAVSFDGTVKFSGVRRGARYYIRRPGGGMMTIDVPAQVNEEPTVTLPDGTSAVLTADYAVTGVTAPDRQWELTVRKVISGGTTPLAGASIGLYADAACQALIKSGVSAQDGTVLFSGLLKGQRYWLKETAAPSNYELGTAVYEADEADPSVTIANTPKVPPVTPDEPNAPVTPDEPGASSRPGTPGRPNSPDEPSASGVPDTPVERNAPDEPGTPSEPNAFDEPGTSSLPGTSDELGISNVPDTSDEPGISDESGDSSEPGASVYPGGGDAADSSGSLNIPQTGDRGPILAVITALSGILLAGMLLCPSREPGKREKK